MLGMGLGPIPWTAIDAYARRENIEGEDFEDLLYMVRSMDDAWLEYQYEQSKSAGKK